MADDHANKSPSVDQSGPPRVRPQLNRRLTRLKWLALVGGLVLLAGGAWNLYRAQQLIRSGATVVGELHDSATTRTSKGRTVYKLTLDYTPEGSSTTYRKEFVVSESLYNAGRIAGRAPVTFMPSDPEFSQVGSEVAPEYEPLAMGAGLLLVSGALAYYQRRQMKRIDQYIYQDSALTA